MMKKILTICLSISLLLCSTSCDEFLDVNRDPDAPANAPVELLLPAAIASTASVVGGNYAIIGGIWSQIYTQNNSSNQYKSTDGFNLQNSEYNISFNELYAGALNDFETIRKQSKASKNWSMYLAATAMQAYTWQVIVDLYDQAAFDEALHGDAIRAPHYQDGDVIYDSLILRLNYALSRDFDEEVAGIRTSKNPGAGDFVFGDPLDPGDDLNALVDASVANWKRFANTLKLKIFLRQIKARPTVADAGIQDLFDNGVQFLTTDAAITQFEDETSKSNPLYEQDQRTSNTNGNLRASRTMLSYLQANADTRIPKFYLPGSAGQRALDQGNYEAPTTIVPVGVLSRALINAVDPVYFISKTESYFLQAEAALRGYGTGNPETLFDQGVTASFQQFGLAPMNYNLPGTTFDADFEQIMIQKWVALCGGKQGIEAFFERNRTNYPATSAVYSGLPDGNVNPAYVPGQFVYPKEGVTSGLFAKRLLFPDTERRRNSNTPDEVPITTAVWWDVD